MPDETLLSNQAAEFIKRKLAHLECLAWQPVVRAGDGDLKASKFAGKPWLSADESYPTCPNCENPMEFILQLNLEELPEAVNQRFGKGLFQLFYCFQDDCDVDYEGWAAFSPVQIARVIQPEGEPAEFEVPIIEGECLSKQVEGPLPAKLIVGWQQIEDYPNWEDVESYGVTLTEGEHQQLITLLPNAIKRTYWHWHGAVGAFMKEAGLHALFRDKLAGYPHWEQSNQDCPNCPICDARMNQLIAQLESNDNIPVHWGDVGSGYIVQCAKHLEQVAFFWQCG